MAGKRGMSGAARGVRSAGQVFNACPRCESPNLVRFEGDAFCSYCPWDSINLREDARFSKRLGVMTTDEIAASDDRLADEASKHIHGFICAPIREPSLFDELEFEKSLTAANEEYVA